MIFCHHSCQQPPLSGPRTGRLARAPPPGRAIEKKALHTDLGGAGLFIFSISLFSFRTKRRVPHQGNTGHSAPLASTVHKHDTGVSQGGGGPQTDSAQPADRGKRGREREREFAAGYRRIRAQPPTSRALHLQPACATQCLGMLSMYARCGGEGSRGSDDDGEVESEAARPLQGRGVTAGVQRLRYACAKLAQASPSSSPLECPCVRPGGNASEPRVVPSRRPFQ